MSEVQELREELLENPNSNQAAAWEAFVSYYGGSLDDDSDLEDFKNRYTGRWKDKETYARYYVSEVDNFPKHYLDYMNWDRLISDWEISDVDLVEYDGMVYVFNLYKLRSCKRVWSF